MAKTAKNPHQLAALETWARPEVRAARSARDKVSVRVGTGSKVVYRSTGTAFRELDLPTAKLQSFRKELKAEGKAKFKTDGKTYSFEVVAK
jgi:hypothetical protein